MHAANARVFETSEADADEVAALAVRTYVDAFGADFRPDDLAEHLSARLSPDRWREFIARDHVLAARIGDELAGYIQFGPAGQPGGVEVFRLYVARPLQRRGLGSRLLTTALDHPDSIAASAIWIGVWEDNFGAQRLYQRFGFEPSGQVRAFALPSGGTPGHDILMVRRTTLTTRED